MAMTWWGRKGTWQITGIATSIVAAAIAPSCSPSFSPKTCAKDDECGSGLVCTQQSGSFVCSAPDAPAATLRIGISAPISGPSQDLGTEMKKGVQLAFDEANAAGGVHGRKLDLVVKDDQYVPSAAESAVRELLDVQDLAGVPPKCPTTASTAVSGAPPVSQDALKAGPNAVLALLGDVGTPTMVRTAPIAVETSTLVFGFFTGSAKMLRDGQAGPCSRFIFNVRASYAQEARATLEYFLKQRVPDSNHLVSFDQNDTFGDAGYNGLIKAWTDLHNGTPPSPAPGQDATAPIKRFRYTRDDTTSVPAQVAATTAYLTSLLAQDNQPHVVGIFMTDTYGPGTSFIQGVRQWQYDTANQQQQQATRLTLLFSNVSFVGPNSIADRLKQAGTINTPTGAKPYTDGVFVSQVVPNYQSDNSDSVHQFLKLLNQGALSPSFTALEGYLAARVFIAGLQAHQATYTADALVPTFENLGNLGLGLGAAEGFGPGQHQYSKSVWGTSINPDGTFANRYFWTDGTPIQLFE